MKWNIFYTLRGPGGSVETPNTGNPVESSGLKTLLANVANGLPDYSQLGAEFVGFRAEAAPDKDYSHIEGEWGALPQEPCRHCRKIGCVEFLIDEGPEGRVGLSPVRCSKCKRSWVPGETSA